MFPLIFHLKANSTWFYLKRIERVIMMRTFGAIDRRLHHQHPKFKIQNNFIVFIKHNKFDFAGQVQH